MLRPVILAAGRGRRLGTYTEDIPKLFVEVDGRTILEWQLEALRPLVDSGNIDSEITIVLGHGFDPDEVDMDAKLERYLPANSPLEFRILTLPNWEQVENAASARTAIETLNDDALLLCGDVIPAEALLRNVVKTFEAEHESRGWSAVSAIEGIQDEMTAVQWDDDRSITDYGAIEGHREAGVFVLNSDYFDAARETWMENSDDWFPIIFPDIPSKAITVREDRLFEINTEAHLERANAHLPFDEDPKR